MSESELLALDQKILRECGPAPWVQLEKEQEPPTVLGEMTKWLLLSGIVVFVVWPFLVWWRAGHPM